MPVLALGVSYRRAPVELLERLSFTDVQFAKAYGRLADLEAVHEAVVLSTCNRVEVFADVDSYHAGFLDLKRFLAESREVAPEEFADPLYSHYEDDAAEHLFAVAGGLDSMVVGEPQILSQVRAAYRRAEAEGSTGPTLSSLFRAAVRTGRRIRAETAVGASPAAFVEAGAGFADRALGGLAGRSILVIGAGGMADLAARHFRTKGVGHLRVLNRRPDRAQGLAARVGGEGGGLDQLEVALAQSDLVVSSTAAPGIVISTEAMRRAGHDGGGAGVRVVLDLAVPRDVDPGVGNLPGVRLVDIDDLRGVLEEAGGPAAGEVDRARAIVAEEVRRFASWRRAARLAPLIQALRDRGARIQASELARVAPRLGDLTDKEWAAVQALAGGIVAKLLHEPIVRLKERTATGGGDALAREVADLFGLDPGRGD